ncbi:hypothetical protein BCR44DRAFT_1481700 [Catenaria anguillulae PL171]|uniref:Uncharacterized protein n=1 Tax=Catenaria anguillulae PL171 TaxID=765915 RepID=A0A1Y2I483_9FUNG|nr:hypothetical protein BCR44DRAFT_1481700 [Catenaria anguillulae PL171]
MSLFCCRCSAAGPAIFLACMLAMYTTPSTSMFKIANHHGRLCCPVKSFPSPPHTIPFASPMIVLAIMVFSISDSSVHGLAQGHRRRQVRPKPAPTSPDETATLEVASSVDSATLNTLVFALTSLALLVTFVLGAMIAHRCCRNRKRKTDDPFAFEHTKLSETGGPGDRAVLADLSSPATLEAVPLTGNSAVPLPSTKPRPPPVTAVGSGSDDNGQLGDAVKFRVTVWDSPRPPNAVAGLARRHDGCQIGQYSESGDAAIDLEANNRQLGPVEVEFWVTLTREDTASLPRGRSTLVVPRRSSDDSGSLARKAIGSSSRRTSTMPQQPSASIQSTDKSESILHLSLPRLPSLEFPSTLSRPSAPTSPVESNPTTPAPIPRPSPAWPVTDVKPMLLPTSYQLSTPVLPPRRGILAPGRSRATAVSSDQLVFNSRLVTEHGIVLDTVTPDQARMTMISFLDSEYCEHAVSHNGCASTVGSTKAKGLVAAQAPVTPKSAYSLYDIGYYMEPETPLSIVDHFVQFNMISLSLAVIAIDSSTASIHRTFVRDIASDPLLVTYDIMTTANSSFMQSAQFVAATKAAHPNVAVLPLDMSNLQRDPNSITTSVTVSPMPQRLLPPSSLNRDYAELSAVALAVRVQSTVSLADTILSVQSVVSAVMDIEAEAWKDVPGVLRETIKNILLALHDTSSTLQSHALAIVQQQAYRLPHPPTSPHLDPATLNDRLAHMESQLTHLLDTRKSESESFARRESALRTRITDLEAELDRASTRMSQLAHDLPAAIQREAEESARKHFDSAIKRREEELQKTRGRSHSSPETGEMQKAAMIAQRQVEERISKLELSVKSAVAVAEGCKKDLVLLESTMAADREGARARDQARSHDIRSRSQSLERDVHDLAKEQVKAREAMTKRVEEMEAEILAVAKAVHAQSKQREKDADVIQQLKQRGPHVLEALERLDGRVAEVEEKLEAMGLVEKPLTRKAAELLFVTQDQFKTASGDFEAQIEALTKVLPPRSPSPTMNPTSAITTRLDVELMLEARDDQWHQHFASLRKSAGEVEETMREMTSALAGIHAAMADRAMIKQVTLDLATVHAGTQKDVSRLGEQLTATRRELASLSAEAKSQHQHIASHLQQKVDSASLTDLLRSTATREDMKKYVEKKVKHLVTQHFGGQSPADAIQGLVKRQADLDVALTRLGALAPKVESVESALSTANAKLQALRDDVNTMNAAAANRRNGRSPIRQALNGGIHQLDSPPSMYSMFGGGMLNSEDYEILHHKLTSAMDEKLFLIASEISTLRASFAGVSAHPLLRGSVWLWRTGTLKHGSGIPWSLEAQNTDKDNLRWEPDACVVRVAEAGVYELAFCFFTRLKPSIQVVINGESVMSAIHAPTYTVHHGSGKVTDGDGRVKEGSATGLSLRDYVNLPAKSTVCLHWHGKLDQAVEGFMALRRVN